jgi:16S rRNA processing protein RimM
VIKYIPVGRVLSAHGINGEVKFRYYNDEKEVFYRYTSFFVKSAESWTHLQPTGISLHKNVFRIKFRGLDKLGDISFLINKELFVEEGNLPGLDENEYYEYQLIGLDVLKENDESLGKAGGIIRTGANDCLIVRGDQEILIPMIEDYILDINLDKGFIRVRDFSYPS